MDLTQESNLQGTGSQRTKEGASEVEVQELFLEGQALSFPVPNTRSSLSNAHEAGRLEEAEEVWKKVLQISPTDLRTILHLTCLLKDEKYTKKDPNRADQLLSQAMGEWATYAKPGLMSPASSSELYRKAKMTSPKKDIERLEFVRQACRSKVEFHALKGLREQLRRAEPPEEEEEENDGQPSGEGGEDGSAIAASPGEQEVRGGDQA